MTVLVVRFSLDPELAETVASEPREIDPSFQVVPIEFALEPFMEKVMA